MIALIWSHISPTINSANVPFEKNIHPCKWIVSHFRLSQCSTGREKKKKEEEEEKKKREKEVAAPISIRAAIRDTMNTSKVDQASTISAATSSRCCVLSLSGNAHKGKRMHICTSGRARAKRKYLYNRVWCVSVLVSIHGLILCACFAFVLCVVRLFFLIHSFLLFKLCGCLREACVYCFVSQASEGMLVQKCYTAYVISIKRMPKLSG